jgi:hypothetical protein
MKKIIYGLSLFMFLTLLGTRCSEDEQQPNNVTADAAGRKAAKHISQPITGTINSLPFTAEYQITKFVNEGGQLYAIGSLQNISGTGLPATVADLSSQQLKLPVTLPSAASSAVTAQAAATCDVLFLQLGPLDLNLLGLVVHLDQVTLTIDAQQGPGNLLGNLLCAITGLLDSPTAGVLNQIAQLLNQIIGLIGTL